MSDRPEPVPMMTEPTIAKNSRWLLGVEIIVDLLR